MTGTIRVTTERSRLILAPSFGGAIASLQAKSGTGDWVQVLRPWSGRSEDGPFALASNILLPFSNRISGGGFEFEGCFFPLSPNLPGEPLPLHGDGFQRAWHLQERNGNQVRLACREGSIGPFRYAAWQRFDLGADSLRVGLGLINLSGLRLPFGVGFHPWFPRTPQTRIAFSAASVWLQDEAHLPTSEIPIERGSAWDFSRPVALPETWINNGFEGWTGTATLHQPGMTVTIQASPELSRAIVFSPSGSADFFCFEPVSHPVDAHHLPGQPGLVALDHGQNIDCWMKISWQ